MNPKPETVTLNKELYDALQAAAIAWSLYTVALVKELLANPTDRATQDAIFHATRIIELAKKQTAGAKAPKPSELH